MEQQVKVRAPDKKVIFGTLNQRRKTDKLVIFVHGLTGHQNEHIFYNAARFFPQHGFATLRFDLYSFDKKARKLRTTMIRQHAQDLDTLVARFSRRYKRIYVVGHSLGGPSILLSGLKNVEGIILWDPSVGRKHGEAEDWCKYDKHLDAYVLLWNADVLLGKEYFREWTGLPDQPKLAAGIGIPVRVILAGKGTLRKRWTKAKDQVIIPGATHCFDEEGAEEKLFKATLEFLKKH